MKRKSQAFLESDSDSGSEKSSESGSDLDKEMLSLSKKKKAAPLPKKLKPSNSDSSEDSDSDWGSKGKEASGSKSTKPVAKKPAKRTGRRSTSGTHSESSKQADEQNSDDDDSQVNLGKTDKKTTPSDLEEGEVSSSDISDDSSEEEFNDGYDDDLMGDAEDRQRLNMMTEKEREQEIFKRIEQRDQLKTRFEIEKKLRQARKKENKKQRKQQMLQQQHQEKDTDADSEFKMDAKERSKERKKTVEGKVDKKSQAMDLLRAKREAKLERQAEKEKLKKEKERIRSMKEEKSLLDDDLDMDGATSTAGTERSKKKLKASDIYSDDSGSDWEGASVDARKEKKGSRSSSDSKSSDSEAEERKRKPTFIEIRQELDKLRVTRNKFEQWLHLPFFSRVIKGCFVRIGIGGNNDDKPVYRIGEIMEVVETTKVYQLGKTRTNKGIKLRHGSNEKVFRLEFVSNSEFSDQEFIKWKEANMLKGITLPTHEDIQKKIKDIKEANEYQYKEEDIEQIIQEKQKFKNSPVNFAVKKTQLLKEREEALSKNDEQRLEEIKIEIQEIDERTKELDKCRNIGLKSISYINERNRKKNVEEAEKAILEEIKQNKGKKVEDPFTRRNTKPTLTRIQKKNHISEIPFGESNLTASDSPKQLTDEPEKTLPAALINPTILPLPLIDLNLDVDGSTDEVDGKKKNGDLFVDHDFEIKLDLDAKLPPNLPIISRPSVPQIREAAPRRSLNLEDYKRKRGLI